MNHARLRYGVLMASSLLTGVLSSVPSGRIKIQAEIPLVNIYLNGSRILQLSVHTLKLHVLYEIFLKSKVLIVNHFYECEVSWTAGQKKFF